MVATDEAGIADFATLQRTVSKRQEGGLALWAFDLLHAGGKDIRRVPCIERKRRLASFVAILGSSRLHHSESFGDGDRLLTECSKRGFEGIACKHRDSSYRSGKQTTSIKVKCQAWREANRSRHKLLER
jgi:bifunctional non-homologous end joining protein LigD